MKQEEGKGPGNDPVVESEQLLDLPRETGDEKIRQRDDLNERGLNLDLEVVQAAEARDLAPPL